MSTEVCNHGVWLDHYCRECGLDQANEQPMTDIPNSPFKVGEQYPTKNGHYKFFVAGIHEGKLLVTQNLGERTLHLYELSGFNPVDNALSLIPPVTYEYYRIYPGIKVGVWRDLERTESLEASNYSHTLRREVGTDNITLIKKGEDLE